MSLTFSQDSDQPVWSEFCEMLLKPAGLRIKAKIYGDISGEQAKIRGFCYEIINSLNLSGMAGKKLKKGVDFF